MLFDCHNRKINYLRISVTDRCNLRCIYCMPEEGIKLLQHEEVLSLEEIAEVAEVAVRMGIDKIRLTGGEPLLRKNILWLVERIARIDGVKDFGMTTNGMFLDTFAAPLKAAGLHRLNISLDTLNPDSFSTVTRGGDLMPVLSGIKAASAAGFKKTKLNCVIHESSEEPDAKAVASFAAEHGFEVRYIRRMCLKNGRFWPVVGGDGGRCDRCNRIRLSSDGNIYSCLFDGRSFSVREYGPESAIKKAVEAKPESGRKSDSNNFYTLGG